MLLQDLIFLLQCCSAIVRAFLNGKIECMLIENGNTKFLEQVQCCQTQICCYLVPPSAMEAGKKLKLWSHHIFFQWK